MVDVLAILLSMGEVSTRTTLQFEMQYLFPHT